MSFRLLPNPRAGTPGLVVLPDTGFRRAKAEIAQWPGYAPTPLHDLPGLATLARIGTLRLKDESGRFGLGSFKALGGAYAVAETLLDALARQGITATATELRASPLARDLTVTCATDGNHGRSVAWAAASFGARCCIFVHETVSQGRADAIARFGAEIRRVPGTYDDAVRAAEAAATEFGWLLVADTAWPGYTEIPRTIMQGYRVMPDEALAQWQGDPPTHFFVQAGVGGAAAAISVQLRVHLSPPPALIVVEPSRAACLLLSAEAGRPSSAPGALDTLMAGLACGEPSLLAWQELERGAAAFLAIDDEDAVAAMRQLAAAGIVSGESGAAGLAGLLAVAGDAAARSALGLTDSSRVLLFSTEGATDPALYARLVA